MSFVNKLQREHFFLTPTTSDAIKVSLVVNHRILLANFHRKRDRIDKIPYPCFINHICKDCRTIINRD